MADKKETQAAAAAAAAAAAVASAAAEAGENQEEQAAEEQPRREPSRIFKALSQIVFLFLLGALGVAVFLSLLTLDFLDIYRIRHSVPETWRGKWPFSQYFDFVQLHQLPEEERYQQLILQEQERFNTLITQGSRDLEQRAKSLEDSYRALIRSQKERHSQELEALRKQREELALESAKLQEGNKDLENRKVAVDELSNRLASETLNLESSLIRFMEQENKMEQVRTIAAQMEPKALSTIFDEVPDDKLIYEILSGLKAQHAAKVLGGMDPEKAGKIMKLGQMPITLPPPGPARSYVPPSLQNLIDETQANLR